MNLDRFYELRDDEDMPLCYIEEQMDLEDYQNAAQN